MRESVRCIGFSYSEVAGILQALGFAMAPSGAGSHRHWSKLLPTGVRVIIGVVDAGHGEMKPVYIKDMLKQLAEHGFLPNEE